MNRERTKELLPVMQAYVDGAKIQTKLSHQREWHDISDPGWASLSAYRIKPKPREFWINESSWVATPAEDFIPKNMKDTIKVREIVK